MPAGFVGYLLLDTCMEAKMKKKIVTLFYLD